ncbi:MAG: T9SS type A sorting domain-containing protein, partial [Bacteroidota bacterium]
FTCDVLVSDDLAYFVNWARSEEDAARGLWIVDISDIHKPRVLSHHIGITRLSRSYVHPNSIAKSGNLVFLTQTGSNQNDSTLEIIDVGNPEAPRQLSFLQSTFSPYDVAVKDSIVYLATPNGGLRIIDWHKPESPNEIGFFNNNSANYSVVGIAASESFIYADRIDTFFVLNVSNPSSPVVVGKFGRNYGSFTSTDVHVADSFAYWADGYLGVIDVSDPSRPRERALFSGLDWGRGVAAKGNLVFFADQTAGLWILRNDLVTSVDPPQHPFQPLQYQLFQNYPNPFNDQTSIEFFAPHREAVRLEVFNLLGQKVATLLSGVVEAGSHKVSFDASVFSSGFYMYRLQSPSVIITKLMLLLK